LILKSLTIENFRSYGPVPTRFDFERGVTLFEGDIGSGKSSILYAIEFALFGLGDIDARHILRSAATSSRVELDFEVENEEYKVVRTIERKKGSKTLSTSGWLSEKGGNLTGYTPTELRTRMLRILNFKERLSTKSSSRIFRFAVFTPQELMREVLSQRPDERIETLRRAFGIEDYSNASSNADVVVRALRARAEIDSSISRPLPEKESNLDKLKKSVALDRSRAEEARMEISSFEREISEKEKDLSELEAARDQARSIETILPQMQKALDDARSQLSAGRSRVELLKRDLLEIQRAKLTVSSLAEEYALYKRSKERMRSLEHLRDEEVKLDSKIGELEARIGSKESSLKAELSSRNDDLKRCTSTIASFEKELGELGPLREWFAQLERRLREEKEPLARHIEEARSEIASRRAIIAAKREQIANLDNTNNDDELKDLKVCPMCGQELDPAHIEKVASERREKIQAIRAEIEDLGNASKGFEARLRDLESKRASLDETQLDYERTGRKLAALEQTSKLLEKTRSELDELKSRISSLHDALQNKEYSSSERIELANLIAKKQEMSEPLKEYDGLRGELQRLDSLEVERRYLSAQEKAKREAATLTLIQTEEESLSRVEYSIEEKSKEISERRAELEALEPMIFHYSKMKDAIAELRQQRERARTTYDSLSSALAINSKNLEELEKEVVELKKRQESANRSKTLATWLETLFLPTISEIETYVLDTINEEFERMFERWFSILIEEGDIEVKLDERFTPLVVQSGYDLDIESLSGGERTAVALAYRLALNFMVRKASEAASTNLLILDEPTEGFSKEQVYRLRNVFEELDSDQIILVSHERDLETMADRVYRVEKVAGESRLYLAK